MSKTRTEVLEESRKKGFVAGAATTAVVAAGVVLASPVVAVVGAVPRRVFHVEMVEAPLRKRDQVLTTELTVPSKSR